MPSASARPSQCLPALLSRARRARLPLPVHSKTSASTVAALDAPGEALGLDALGRVMGLVPADNGSESGDVEGIERSRASDGERRCRVFFCDPTRPRRKGACERNHVEMRKLLPKGRGISFDDLDEVDACSVGPDADSEPRPSLMGMSPLAMLRAAEPGIADALAGIGIPGLPHDEVEPALGAMNRERAARGLRPLA